MNEIANLIRLTHPSAAQDVMDAERALYDAQEFLFSMLRNDDAFNGYSEEALWDAIKEITNN